MNAQNNENTPTILKALNKLYKDLKNYKNLTEYLSENNPIMGHKIKERDKLREKLIRNTSILKKLIIELTGKQLMNQNMNTYDIWDEAFNPTSQLPTSLNRNAINFCIDATNEAIGKLKVAIKKGTRDKETGELIKESGNIDWTEKDVINAISEALNPNKLITENESPDATFQNPGKEGIKVKSIESVESPKAFISHGKESVALRKLTEFLETLGVAPIIVKNQASLNKDLPDKINSYLNQSDFVIILATGDDKVTNEKTRKEKTQPRQNVIHEIGLAQKTHPCRIIYLLEEGAEFPSNIRPKVWETFKQRNMMNAFLGILRELRAYGMLKVIKTQSEEQ
jgi:predicted nucleotide-binding protein